MTNRQLIPTVDPVLAARLADAVNRCFEGDLASASSLSDDVFCDLLPPHWRFQLEGRDALAAQLRAITPEGSTVRRLRLVPTASGFVMEHEHSQPRPDGQQEVARRLVLCEVRDERVTEILVYCNGPWDDELRARHAADAPMLRP